MTDKATDKPFTLQECKDKVAKQHYFKNWETLLRLTTSPIIFAQMCNQAAELYKDSALEAQKEEIERLKQELGFTEIHATHQSTLLESCEKALESRDSKIEALEQALKKAHNLPPYL